MSEVKEWLTMFGVITLILGAIAGLFGSLESRHGRGGCEYKAVADYFPTRAIVCEIFRERWD